MFSSCLLLLLFTAASPLYAVEPHPLPRTIIAVYSSNSAEEAVVHNTRIHLFAEMPLNHLGYRLEYHDVAKALPDLHARSDVLGVLSWFPADLVVPNPRQYLRWAIDAIGLGKRFVIVENPGFYAEGDDAVSPREVNQLWSKLGLRDRNRWNVHTYATEWNRYDRRMLGFERNYTGLLPAFRQFTRISPELAVHASVFPLDRTEDEHPVVVTGPQGSMILHDYAIYLIYNNEGNRRQWFVNPFRFFRMAFDASDMPKPDTTTLAGQRLQYNHMDGDGWNNVTFVESYRGTSTLCAEVLLREIVKPHSDLPFTIGPIAADIDLEWFGTQTARQAAQKLFSLPNVEVGCHTFTHPFDWTFFAHYRPEDEKPYLNDYPNGSWAQPTVTSTFEEEWDKLIAHFKRQPFHYPIKILEQGYLVPRAYALKPFNLELEINGAIRDVAELAKNTGKAPAVYQWSGDCLPFEAALQKAREAGIPNLNGGNTRFDDEFSSYAWVSPLGRQVGREQQIYASNSNENTYTHMWTGKYYGFDQLPQTFKNTETPMRLRPMNLYFHAYSCEREPGLTALKGNIAYIVSQECTPVTASHFTRIVNGFYTTEFFPEGTDRWRISHRGGLQTIRIDDAVLKGVDFARSTGVVGQRHFQGSLYIYLDASVEEPVVALQAESQFWTEPPSNVAYLINSRWPVWNVERSINSVAFTTQGFGKGEMRWHVPSNAVVEIEVDGEILMTVTPEEGIIQFVLGHYWKPQRVKINLAPNSYAFKG